MRREVRIFAIVLCPSLLPVRFLLSPRLLGLGLLGGLLGGLLRPDSGLLGGLNSLLRLLRLLRLVLRLLGLLRVVRSPCGLTLCARPRARNAC